MDLLHLFAKSFYLMRGPVYCKNLHHFYTTGGPARESMLLQIAQNNSDLCVEKHRKETQKPDLQVLAYPEIGT